MTTLTLDTPYDRDAVILTERVIAYAHLPHPKVIDLINSKGVLGVGKLKDNEGK